MTPEPHVPAGVPTVDAAEAWRVTADGVVRGIAHALSNRVGTLGALAEALAASDPEGTLPPLLADEVARLHELLRALRLLPRDEGRGAEPLRPADAVADAALLLAQHPNGRDARVTVTGGDDAPPVRAHVPSLVHALLLLLVAAAGEAGAPVTVELEGDAEQVTIRVVAPAAASLVAPDGGAAAAAEGSLALILPTLAATRRRDRAAG